MLIYKQLIAVFSEDKDVWKDVISLNAFKTKIFNLFQVYWMETNSSVKL